MTTLHKENTVTFNILLWSIYQQPENFHALFPINSYQERYPKEMQCFFHIKVFVAELSEMQTLETT